MRSVVSEPLPWGKWVKGKNRTVNNLTANFNDYKKGFWEEEKKIKNLKHVEFEPMQLKKYFGD